MKKLTALEWYHTKLAEPTTQAKDVNTIFLLAKEMEKEQIKEAYILQLSSEYWFKDEDFFQTEAEQYYTSTYES
jgi:hypothetical protein